MLAGKVAVGADEAVAVGHEVQDAVDHDKALGLQQRIVDGAYQIVALAVLRKVDSQLCCLGNELLVCEVGKLVTRGRRGDLAALFAVAVLAAVVAAIAVAVLAALAVFLLVLLFGLGLAVLNIALGLALGGVFIGILLGSLLRSSVALSCVIGTVALVAAAVVAAAALRGLGALCTLCSGSARCLIACSLLFDRSGFLLALSGCVASRLGGGGSIASRAVCACNRSGGLGSLALSFATGFLLVA